MTAAAALSYLVLLRVSEGSNRSTLLYQAAFESSQEDLLVPRRDVAFKAAVVDARRPALKTRSTLASRTTPSASGEGATSISTHQNFKSLPITQRLLHILGGGKSGSKPGADLDARKADGNPYRATATNASGNGMFDPSLPPPLCVLKYVAGSLTAHQVLLARGFFGLEDAVQVLPLNKDFNTEYEFGGGGGALTLEHAENQSVISKDAREIVRYFQRNLSHVAYVEAELIPKPSSVLGRRCAKLEEWFERDLAGAMLQCARSRATQDIDAYHKAVHTVFASLERLEHILTYQPMVAGRNLSVSDIKLFPILLRLDHVFHALGANRNYVAQMPSIHAYMRAMYQIPGIAEGTNLKEICSYYFNCSSLNPGGFHTKGPEFDLDTVEQRRPRIGIDGFYVKPYPIAEEPGLTLQVQQVSACGDCLFQSIAIGLAFARDLRHLSMYDSSLKTQSVRLRNLAVNTLRTDTDLFMQDDEYISTGELVGCAAEQFNISSERYLSEMRKLATWGGGPEIVALANALRRPIHVYEPECSEDKKSLSFVSCGKFGSPMFDDKRPIYILAADDRFPECKPSEVRRHGSGGNHFLALIPNWSNLTETDVYEKPGC